MFNVFFHDANRLRCFRVVDKEARVKVEDRRQFFENQGQNIKEEGRFSRSGYPKRAEIALSL